MTQSRKTLDDLFLTTNQDYGAFYSGRLQYSQIDPDQIAFELSINDQVRKERCQLPSIAYDIMFDKNDFLKIVAHDKKKSKVEISGKTKHLLILVHLYQPVTSRRQLKYIKSKGQSNEERQLTIASTVKYYTTLIQCIYANKEEKNPHLSSVTLELLANELLLLKSGVPSDELAEYMVAVTVPHEYLGMSTINPNKPYPGTQADCGKGPGLQRLLDRFQSVKKTVEESKEQFDSQSIDCQAMEGVRYIYNPSSNIPPFCRI